MKNSISILLMLFCTQVFAQDKILNVPTGRFGKMTLEEYQEKTRNMNLDDLTKSKQVMHFRYWTAGQAIDIWTDDSQSFTGTFSNYAIGPFSKDDRYPFHSSSYVLDTATARTIYGLFADAHILQMPPGDSIRHWGGAIDAPDNIIEYVTPGYYSFKTYGYPYMFRNEVKEAAALNNVVEQLRQMLDMDEEFNTFLYQLPLGCYYRDAQLAPCNDWEEPHNHNQ